LGIQGLNATQKARENTASHVIGDNMAGAKIKSWGALYPADSDTTHKFIYSGARNFSEWQVHSELSGSGWDPLGVKSSI